MQTETKIENRLRKRTPQVAEPAPVETQKQIKSPGIMEKVKYFTHFSLIITERIINGLMNVYEKIFVADHETRASFFMEQGFKHFDRGDYENAITNFLTCTNNGGKDNPEILYYLGLSYIHIESPEEAIVHLKHAEQIHGEDPDIVSEIGSCLLTMEKYPEAITYLRKAIQLLPDGVTNYYRLGTAHEKSGQLQKAIDMYRKSIDIDPKDPIYYHALGFVFETMGKHNDAIACFRKAMELEKSRQ